MTFPAPTHPRTTLAQDLYRSAELMRQEYSSALDTFPELAEQYWQAAEILTGEAKAQAQAADPRTAAVIDLEQWQAETVETQECARP